MISECASTALQQQSLAAFGITSWYQPLQVLEYEIRIVHGNRV